MELERMKNNAFHVAKEVAERVDGGVAPGGYIKSFVTLEEDKLFFWDKKYLTAFTERKPSEVVPGQNYFSKVEEFTKLHAVVGEKYIEFIKFGCKDVHGDICKFCSDNGWNDIECSRIPEPMPDYKSERFAYLHVNKTPHEIDGIKREVNDYNPRQRRKNTANLQTWFGGRFRPKIEEGLVVKNKTLYCRVDLEDESSINTWNH